MKNQTKTFREWFNELDEPFKSQAIENTEEYLPDLLVDFSLSEAISKAFVWKETPQGHEYWSELVEKLETTEL